LPPRTHLRSGGHFSAAPGAAAARQNGLTLFSQRVLSLPAAGGACGALLGAATTAAYDVNGASTPGVAEYMVYR